MMIIVAGAVLFKSVLGFQLRAGPKPLLRKKASAASMVRRRL